MSLVTINGFGVVPCFPGATLGPEPTAFAELIWMLDGPVSGTIEGKPFAVQPRDLLVLRHGAVRSFVWDPRSPTHHGFVLFDGPDEYTSTTRIFPAEDDFVAATLDHLIWLESERPDGWFESGSQVFQYALPALLEGRAGTSPSAPPALGDVVDRVVGHVHARWKEGPLRLFSLAELSAFAGVTPEHLCRVFATRFGTGPIHAFRLIRLRYAAVLLVQSSLPLANVAEIVGFANEFHFSRSFKSVAGESPRSFRESGRRAIEVPAEIRRLEQRVFPEMAVSQWMVASAGA